MSPLFLILHEWLCIVCKRATTLQQMLKEILYHKPWRLQLRNHCQIVFLCGLDSNHSKLWFLEYQFVFSYCSFVDHDFFSFNKGCLYFIIVIHVIMKRLIDLLFDNYYSCNLCIPLNIEIFVDFFKYISHKTQLQ